MLIIGVDWVGIGIGSTITVVITVVIGYALLRRKRPRYSCWGNSVVTEQPDWPIEIRFKGRDVPRVTRSLVAFWNAGRATIDGSDIAGGLDPIKVKFRGEVLTRRVLKASRPAIGFVVNAAMRDNTASVLSFDFPDHGDGATIEVLHTGADVAPEVTGTIKGAPPIRAARSPDTLNNLQLLVLLIGSVPAVWAAVVELPAIRAALIGTAIAAFLFFVQLGRRASRQSVPRSIAP